MKKCPADLLWFNTKTHPFPKPTKENETILTWFEDRHQRMFLKVLNTEKHHGFFRWTSDSKTFLETYLDLNCIVKFWAPL